MGYCSQNEIASQSHQTRSFLALQTNMSQAKLQHQPEFETCFECRPVMGMLKDLDIKASILTSERAKALNERESTHLQNWLMNHRTLKRHGIRATLVFGWPG